MASVQTSAQNWKIIRSIISTATAITRPASLIRHWALPWPTRTCCVQRSGTRPPSEDAIHKGNNGYGEVYELRLSLTTPKGTATVLSACVIRYGEDFPKLTTCFIV